MQFMQTTQIFRCKKRIFGQEIEFRFSAMIWRRLKHGNNKVKTVNKNDKIDKLCNKTGHKPYQILFFLTMYSLCSFWSKICTISVQSMY